MNGRIKNESGKKYNSLRVIEITERREPSNGCVVWKCKCDCGNVHFVNGNALRFGKIKSCGKCNKKRW